MGSFAYLIGDYHVTNEQEVYKNILQLLNEGGMMQLKKASLFDKDIILIKQISESDETQEFHYNYFEDCGWESAYVKPNGKFGSNKKGGKQFSAVVCAVYLYMEMVSETPCIALTDGELISSYALGWINQVLGTKFTTTDRYINLWEKAQLINFEEDSEIFDDMLSDMERYHCNWGKTYGDFMAINYFQRNDELKAAVEKLEKEEEELPAEKRTLKIFDCIRITSHGVHEYMKTHTYEDVIEVPFNEEKIDEVRKNEDGFILFHFVPVQIFAEIIANETDKAFDEVWNDIKDKKYPYISMHNEDEKEDVVPENIETATFLHFTDFFPDKSLTGEKYILTDDDRIYWNANPSEKLSIWFDELKERYQKTEPKKIDIKEFIDLFAKADNIYRHIFPFSDMFYEFLTNLNDEQYQKTLILFDELIEENRETGSIINKVSVYWDLTDSRITCNDGRMKIKRYLALLANKEMRKKIFGF